MISIKELAETLRLLTLADIRNLSELLYREYGIEFNMTIDVWRAREMVRNQANTPMQDPVDPNVE